MKDVLEYANYRQYIADYYADRKAKSAFTWPEFAQAAGFSSPVYLKYVSEGRFNLSDAAVERVAKAMHLADYEQEYFAEMVKFDHAKKDADKKTIFKKMLSIAEAHKTKILEGDAFRFFEDWKNPVIRELAPSMPGAKPLALAHACRPEITAAEVSETLKFLLKAGLLKKDEGGNYIQTEKSVTTGNMDVTPVAVRSMHAPPNGRICTGGHRRRSAERTAFFGPHARHHARGLHRNCAEDCRIPQGNHRHRNEKHRNGGGLPPERAVLPDDKQEYQQKGLGGNHEILKSKHVAT